MKEKKDNLTLIRERLEQAKLDGNKTQIKIWSDILKKLERK